MSRSSSLKITRVGLLGLLAPSVAIYTFVIIVPLALSFYYSLTDWVGGPTKNYIGFRNYSLLVHDSLFWHSFKNNMIILALTLIIQMSLAFLLTTLFMSKALRLKELHRTVIFFPVVLSAVVVGFVWQMIYSHDYGILNSILRSIGLESAIRPWLDDPKIVIYSVTVPLIWQYLGIPLMIFVSAVHGIPKDIYESCELDGCTGFKKARYITFPLIYDTIKVVVMLCISSNMLVFSHIYVMTGGGPGTSSMVMAQYAYKTSFGSMQLGYGSAVTIGMFVISFGIVLIFKRLAEVRV
ncbi:sugar ABC transporter permease [Cohnella endophytica]|uniref:Sugar ABC transporter permease n=1 Tax=Cohnella endophytica TaxID=2419778 RepID=A0A494XGS4_9BACL|nr:sugar ABC transporter permease [Cohnella endophytica]RKP46743.1 sugar ABC transporter permease [Cohnella endophytica]